MKNLCSDVYLYCYLDVRFWCLDVRCSMSELFSEILNFRFGVLVALDVHFIQDSNIRFCLTDVRFNHTANSVYCWNLFRWQTASTTWHTFRSNAVPLQPTPTLTSEGFKHSSYLQNFQYGCGPNEFLLFLWQISLSVANKHLKGSSTKVLTNPLRAFFVETEPNRDGQNRNEHRLITETS